MAVESDSASCSALDALKGRVWQIPRNFFRLTGEVVGKGSFGSVIRATVLVEGERQAAVVQVASETRSCRVGEDSLASSISLLSDCSGHPHVLGLFGLCGGDVGESLYVVMEDGAKSLKGALLDTRALVHDPARARRVGRGCTVPEAQLVTHAVEIASAMQFLASKEVCIVVTYVRGLP